QPFTVVASDPNGAADLSYVFLQFQTSQAGTPGNCTAVYNVAEKNTYLFSDDNKKLEGPVTAEGKTNSQCTLTLGRAAKSSGNELTVEFVISFGSEWGGPKKIFAYTQSENGANVGWQLFGTWTLPPVLVQ